MDGDLTGHVVADRHRRAQPGGLQALGGELVDLHDLARAAALRQLDRIPDALTDIAAALTLDPENVEALLERGILRQRQNNPAGARADWERAITLAPDSPTADLARLSAGGAGLQVPASVMAFDIWVMLAVALACLPVFMTGREIARWEGGVFLLYYVAYVAYLILAAQQHDALGTFSAAMMSFVVPITVITLVVVMVRGTTKP